MNFVGTDALYAITCGSMRAFARPCGTWKRAPNACASAWFTPTDAFENAIAAMHAALCIMLRASSSFGCSYAIGRYLNTMRTACIAFESVYGDAKTETPASSAWVRQSTP